MGSDDHKLRNNAIATWQGNENSTRSEGNHPGGLPLSPGTRIRYNNLPHYVNIELLFFLSSPESKRRDGINTLFLPRQSLKNTKSAAPSVSLKAECTVHGARRYTSSVQS